MTLAWDAWCGCGGAGPADARHLRFHSCARSQGPSSPIRYWVSLNVGFRPTVFVVVIDSITEIERAAERSGDPGRAGDYLAALVQALRDHEVTSLILQESHRLLAPELDVSSNAVAALVDNVLVLQQVTQGEALRRVVSVVKMRYSAHDAAVREFRITPPEGIHVLAPIDRDSGQLQSIARASDRLSEKIDNRGGMASPDDVNDQRSHE